MTGHSLVSRPTTPSVRRLRVLTLVDGIGTYGGAESLAREIVQRLDGERFERSFCVSALGPGRRADPTVQRALGELDARRGRVHRPGALRAPGAAAMGAR